MFGQCSSLEEINFNNFNTSKVTTMQKMFSGCANLKSLDLSSFNTSNVENVMAIFDGCTSLEYLDISNFDTSQITNSNSMFNGVNLLKYIILNNAQINNEIKSQIEDKIDSSTIVCQNKEILSKGKKDCSIFTQSDNYIIVKYGTEITYGANTFTNNIDSRKKILYIKNKNKIIEPTTEFKIEANGIIEIYLPKDITSLAKFFSNEDGNTQYITSIDLSHFNSSKVEDAGHMFSYCSSLEEINFNNFVTSKVSNMEYMFYGCSNLKSLDLSSFNTSNVENVMAIFDGCTSLEYLDISNFDTSQVQANILGNIFNGVSLLKYINLYNAKIIDEINNKIEEIIKDSTIICHKDNFNIDTNLPYIKACCEYNDNNFNCFPENYIIIKYNNNIIYENGFQIKKDDFPEYRKNIIFIKNEENIINPLKKLEIKSDSKIEIHLDNSIKSLASFFNSNYDENTKDIISIDFSHLDSSLISDMNFLFSGCSSLQKLDLNNFIINSETSIENIFSGCDNLKYLDISGFNINSYDILNGLNKLEFINI